MAARLIQETDIIEVSRPPVLLFGEPGVGKTSLAQTATKSLTLDFDQGLHRSEFRKTGLRFDSWSDVVGYQRDGGFNDFETINLDTIGTLLEYMSQSIIADNAKMGTRAGGLSLQGWGVLKTTFGQWLSALRQAGKQVIMIAHQKEEKDGDDRVLRPDIAGGSYSIVMNSSDIVGYMSYRNNVRHISWEPTDRYFAKNGAQLKSGPIPDFAAQPHFMAGLLTQAKSNLGHTAQASAAVASAVAVWSEEIGKLTEGNADVAKVTGWLSSDALKELSKAAKSQVWALIQQAAKDRVWTFDDKAKVFVGKPEEKPAEKKEEPKAEETPKFAPTITKPQQEAIEVALAVWGGSLGGKYPDGTKIMPTGKKKLGDLTGSEAEEVLRGLQSLAKAGAA